MRIMSTILSAHAILWLMVALDVLFVSLWSLKAFLMPSKPLYLPAQSSDVLAALLHAAPIGQEQKEIEIVPNLSTILSSSVERSLTSPIDEVSKEQQNKDDALLSWAWPTSDVFAAMLQEAPRAQEQREAVLSKSTVLSSSLERGLASLVDEASKGQQNKEDVSPVWAWPKTEETVPVCKGVRGFQGALTPRARPKRSDVTLATYTSVFRLSRTVKILEKWSGPVSLVLLVQQGRRQERIASTVVGDMTAKHATLFQWVEIHLLIVDMAMYPSPRSVPRAEVWNLAVDAVDTDFLMAVRPHENFSKSLYHDAVAKLKSNTVKDLLHYGKALLHVGDSASTLFVVSKKSGLLPRFFEDATYPMSKWEATLVAAGFRNISGQGSDAALPRSQRGDVLWTDAFAAINLSVPIEAGLSAFSNMVEPVERPPQHDVTLVTQVSVNKMSRVVLLASRWGGPMSVCVYLHPEEAPDFVQTVQRNAHTLRHSAFHLLFHTAQYKGDYPINMARNIALDAADTDLIFADDVDLIPSHATRNQLLQYASSPTWQRRLFRERGLMVAPAFEIDNEGSRDVDQMLPMNRVHLLEMLLSGRAKTFHPDFSPAQASTNYERWYREPTGSEPYETVYQSAKYEPYVMAAKRRASWRLPIYWDFRGFGWNKAQWFIQFNAAKSKFYVATGDAFVIHVNHPQEGPKRRATEGTKKTFIAFKRYVEARYNTTVKVRRWVNVRGTFQELDPNPH